MGTRCREGIVDFLQIHRLQLLPVTFEIIIGNRFCQRIESATFPLFQFFRKKADALQSLIRCAKIIYRQLDVILGLRFHPYGIPGGNNLSYIRSLFPSELVFQIFQFLHLFEDAVLIIYHIEVLDNLAFYLQQIMIRLVKLKAHIIHHVFHPHIHRHGEEDGLIGIYHPFALGDELRYVLQLLAQSLEFRFLDFVIRLILISIIHITLQIQHISNGGKGYGLQAPAHLLEILIFSGFVIFLEIIVDILIQHRDIITHRRNIDFLVHFQHILEELLIHVFHLQTVARITNHSIFYQISDALLLVFGHFQGIVITKLKGMSLGKHLLQQNLFPVKSFNQFIYRMESPHWLVI